ncbi:hypothetical protein SRM_p61034 (plasmid) [Salinibacter ruber M8]|uniref:Uncharacterized protein n=1 Tax=Salinibacter ruber (strain M8) TaxID=761659 RepID=D5H4F0_SALRM|nr:hypothetical protein SRM_p61034 [Salinibacter ruber M8]
MLLQGDIQGDAFWETRASSRRQETACHVAALRFVFGRQLGYLIPLLLFYIKFDSTYFYIHAISLKNSSQAE